MAIKRLYDTLVGATVNVNQLVDIDTSSVTIQSGHKYYAKISGTESIGASTGTAISVTGGTDMVIDLTAMLGSTIADYLYNLETATAGAGIAKLREWGFLTDEYIPYNSGSLESVEARSHVMRGFNQFDETKLTELPNIEKISDGWRATANVWRVTSFDWETIDYIDGQSYCASIDLTNTGTTGLRFEWHYTDGTTTLPTTAIPANGRSTCVVVSDPSKTIEGLVVNYGGNSGAVLTIHSFCINLSNPDRNGEYEPYHEYSYNLGTDTLRGLFKLDSNNNLYADGDTKASDGTVTRKYGTRAYQSGDESLADAITDGTNTVYKLTTPTTETSTPFQNPQICDPDGTEEYVTSNGVPVGHETRYQL